MMRAKLILNPGSWDTPQVGTPNQHRAITKIAKELGWNSMADFLNYSFRPYHKVKEEDGSLRPQQAGWIFDGSRQRLLLSKKKYEWMEENKRAKNERVNVQGEKRAKASFTGQAKSGD